MKEYIEKFMNENNITGLDNLIIGCLVENQNDVNTLISTFMYLKRSDCNVFKYFIYDSWSIVKFFHSIYFVYDFYLFNR